MGYGWLVGISLITYLVVVFCELLLLVETLEEEGACLTGERLGL
jgi:hypothetical protein